MLRLPPEALPAALISFSVAPASNVLLYDNSRTSS